MYGRGGDMGCKENTEQVQEALLTRENSGIAGVRAAS
jgi:hypothetical protein